MKQYFKRSAAALLCLALLMGLFAGVPGALISNAVTTDELTVEEPKNLLADYNPSFENYTIPNWTITPGVAQSKNEDGTWSLKINVQDATATTAEKVAVAPYWTYNASVKIFGAGKLSVVFYGADGAVVDEQSVEKTTAAWDTLTLAAKAPAGAATAAVKLTSTTADAVYFDDASLTQGKMWIECNLLNGGFEEWNTANTSPLNWTVSDSTGYANAAPETVEGRGTVVTFNRDNHKLQIASDKFDVVGGKAYIMTMDVYQSVALEYQFYLQCWDADGKQITITTGQKYVTYPAGYDMLSDNATTGEWTTVAYSLGMPANAAKARILVTAPWAATGVLKLDNATVSLSTAVYDGSFENAPNIIGLPFGHVSTSAQAKNRQNWINTGAEFVKDGTQSLATVTSGWIYSNVINVIPGETYESTVWVKTTAASLETWKSYMQNLIYFYNADGEQLSTKQATTVPTTDWTELTATATAPEGAAFAKIMMYSSGGSLCYLDCQTFAQTSNTGSMLTNNADFETRTTGDKAAMTDWSSNKNTDWSLVEYEPGRGYVAHFTGVDTSQQQVYSTTVDVTAGKTYTVQLDIKTIASTTSWVMVYFNYLDASGNKCTGGYASKITAKPESVDQNREWTTYSGSMKAPDGAAKVQILIVIAGWYEQATDEQGNPIKGQYNYYANQNAYIDNVELYEACEHTWPETADSTTATCKDAGVETYICTACGTKGTKAAAATGKHTDANSDNTCDVCNENLAVASKIAICSNVVVGNNLDMAFGFDKAAVADWTGYTVKLTRAYADGTSADVKEYAVDQWSEDTVNGKYYVTYDGLAFFHMGDEITVEILDAEKNVVSEDWTDSIEAYALRRFAEADATAELKAVLVEMLYFGAAAQEKMPYDQNDLVNAELNDAHNAARPEAKEFKNELTQGDKHAGSNLIVKSHIEFVVAIEGLTTAMSAEVKFTKWDGTEITKNIAGSEFGRNDSYIFVTMPEELSAADARQAITITIKNADGTEYATCQESIEAYLARQSANGNVFEAFMKYADAAKAYLSK